MVERWAFTNLNRSKMNHSFSFPWLARFPVEKCCIPLRSKRVERADYQHRSPRDRLSSPKPKRRLLDWPADVRELVRHLELERYYIIGVSAGGPYALACAHEPAENELLGLGIVAGMGPWALGTKGASIDLKVTLNLVAYASWLARYLMNSKIVKPYSRPGLSQAGANDEISNEGYVTRGSSVNEVSRKSGHHDCCYARELQAGYRSHPWCRMDRC